MIAAPLLLGALAALLAAPEESPKLEDVLARATSYVARYERQLSGLLAEEDYSQTILHGVRFVAHPELQSDFLLLRLQGTVESWSGFRDVFRVDGQKVRDRQDRLEKLFLGGAQEPLEDAKRIAEESARYNIGNIKRTVNLPTLTLTFLDPQFVRRFDFEKLQERLAGGATVWVIAFTEKRRPTVIAGDHGDLFSRGSVWVKPEDGRVVRTDLVVEDTTGSVKLKTTITVEYRDEPKLEMWLPAVMKENYACSRGSVTESIQCEAKYRNFRKFQVASESSIPTPRE